MREIKFRGKRIDNGEWVYGCLLQCYENTDYWIIMQGNNAVRVTPNTVGQYTELKAILGHDIYEGDIVIETYAWRHNKKCLVVKYDTNRGGYFPFARGDGCGCCEYQTWDEKDTEVIGNIYDNPELLEVKE